MRKLILVHSMNKPAKTTRSACVFLFILSSIAQAGNEDNAAGIAFFEAKIRPVLVSQCYSCHSAKTIRSGLRVDSREALLAGGDSGPAMVPGNVDESLIIGALKHESFEMPPGDKLADSVIADFEKWIKMGAPDPREATEAPVKEHATPRGPHWSFQPITTPTIPAVADKQWPAGNIDRFILARIEAASLSPAASADRRTLLRRTTFDLSGLPPTRNEIADFLADRSPNAFEKVVDRLLASPRFGERWGRHWLDVARYSDSNGLDENATHHNAWRYRDYVIRAFNNDKPFDEFVMEQIAGDLLPAESQAQRDEKLTAGAFLVLGPKLLAERDKYKLKMDVIDEQIDVMGRAIMGLTLGCARCHDHKFDAIPTADYYAFAGILQSAVTLDGRKRDNDVVSGWMERPLSVGGEEQIARVRKHDQGIREIEARIRKLEASIATDREKGIRVDGEDAREAITYFLQTEKSAAEASRPPEPPMTMAVREAETPANTRIHVRGNHQNLGAEVPRGVLSTVGMSPVSIPEDQSGRLQLAEWLVDPDHPLVARVAVNRIWHHLFGAGIVRTVDNFGRQGDTPSHPELLDYLAGSFVRDGWSTKRMIRSIVLSRVYQQASQIRPIPGDPDNRLLSFARRRRLDAEAIRDSMLAVSGKLDLAMGGSPVKGFPEIAITERSDGKVRIESSRRSLYLPIIRNEVPLLLQTFDFVDPHVSSGERAVTTVAPQGLFLLNNPFVLEQAQFAAERMLATDVSTIERIAVAYERFLGRLPTAAETDAVRSYFGAEVSAGESRASWTQFCQAIFACTEYRYLD